MNNAIIVSFMFVPLPSWLPKQLKILKPILDDIAPWRLVGGVVRDVLLDIPTVDVDIAISAVPEEVLRVLAQHNMNVVPTGLKHGTVTVYMPDGVRFEITSLRRDDRCDGRHAIVSFTNDWQEDAARRDFTINAMYLDMEGNLYDYFDGYSHLSQRKLVFVGDPRQRIKEDYLRVLRYWRFVASMGMGNIDDASQDAAVELFNGLNEIAGERICTEMLKLLSGPFALEVINAMIMKKILPFVSLCLTQKLDRFTTDPLLNLALMLKRHPGGATLQAISALSSRWRLSNSQRKLLSSLCLPAVQMDWSSSALQHKKYLYLLGWQMYEKLYIIAQAEGRVTRDYMELLKDFTIPIFPLTGNDVKFLKGPAVGAALSMVERYWLEKDFLPSKDDLLIYIKRIYS